MQMTIALENDLIRELLTSSEVEKCKILLSQTQHDDSNQPGVVCGILKTAAWWVAQSTQDQELSLSSLLKEPPASEEVLVGAVTFLESKRPSSSEVYREIADVLIERFPSSGQAWYHRAVILFNNDSGEDLEALASCNRSLSLQPNASCYAMKARIQYSLGDLNSSKTSAQTGIAQFPKDWNLHHQLGIAHSQLKEFKEAFVSFDESLALGGDRFRIT